MQPSPIPGAVQGAGGMWYMPIGMGGGSNTEEMVREALAGIRSMIHPQQEQSRLLKELLAEIRGGGEGAAAAQVHMAQQQQSSAATLAQVLAEVQQLRAHQTSLIEERVRAHIPARCISPSVCSDGSHVLLALAMYTVV